MCKVSKQQIKQINKHKTKNRILKMIAVVIVTSLLVCYGITAYCSEINTQETAKDKTAVISVELFTLGCGYLLEPQTVALTDTQNLSQVLTEALHNAGYNVCYGGSVKQNFYLAYITSGQKTSRYNGYKNSAKEYGTPKNPKKLTINPKIPDLIDNKIQDTMNFYNKNDQENHPDCIGELMYTNGGGFLFSVNNRFSSNNMSSVLLKDGDVVRVQYSLCIGADIGGMWDSALGATQNYYDVANKDALTVLIAQVQSLTYISANTDSAKQNALSIIQKVNATQGEINSAYSRLYNAINDSTNENHSNSVLQNTSSVNSQTHNSGSSSQNSLSQSGTNSINIEEQPTQGITATVQPTTKAKEQSTTVVASDLIQNTTQITTNENKETSTADETENNNTDNTLTNILIWSIAAIAIIVIVALLMLRNKFCKNQTRSERK